MHLLRDTDFWLKVAGVVIPALTTYIVVRATHGLARKMADYQTVLNKELEEHKRDISRGLEDHKFQLQSSFQTKFYEFQTRYSLLHQKRAEAIEKLFELFVMVP